MAVAFALASLALPCRGEYLSFKVLLATDKPSADIMISAPVSSWRAKMGIPAGAKVLEVGRADELIQRQTVIVVDLFHSAPRWHPSLLAEALNVSRSCDAADLTFFVFGDSPDLLLSLDRAYGNRIGIHQASQAPPAAAPGCSGPVGRRSWLWNPQAGLELFPSIARFLRPRSGPVRLLLLSSAYSWFGEDEQCDPDGAKCWHNWEVTTALEELTGKMVVVFPVVFGNVASLAANDDVCLKCARYMSRLLGGSVFTETTGIEKFGTGAGLRHALSRTSSGVVVTIRAYVRGGGEYDLDLALRDQPSFRWRRLVEFPLGMVFQSRPGLDDWLIELYPAVTLDAFRTAPAGDSSSNTVLSIDLPLRKTPGQVVRVILVSASDPAEQKGFTSRHTLSGDDLVETAQGIRITVPLPSSPRAIQRVGVFEETTRWAGLYAAGPAAQPKPQ